jgi:hypothetical protein
MKSEIFPDAECVAGEAAKLIAEEARVDPQPNHPVNHLRAGCPDRTVHCRPGEMLCLHSFSE